MITHLHIQYYNKTTSTTQTSLHEIFFSHSGLSEAFVIFLQITGILHILIVLLLLQAATKLSN